MTSTGKCEHVHQIWKAGSEWNVNAAHEFSLLFNVKGFIS